MSLTLLLKLLAKSFPYAIRLKNIATLEQYLYEANKFIRPTQKSKKRREGMMETFKSSRTKKWGGKS